MSPAGTMARVYQALKARVMAGAFAPGERIDPARLAPELAASVTPIRDALHRLAGERLVENWSQEGFRQPLVTETGLRYLYGWSEDLVRLVLRAGERDRTSLNWSGLDLEPSYAGATAALFESLAGLSASAEHRAAMGSLNDRLHLARLHEPAVVPDAEADLRLIGFAASAGDWGQARRAVGQYHSARSRRVPDLAALLLARSTR